jgi:hypothetical protein
MKKKVLFVLVMVCGLSATGVLIALVGLPSVAEAGPVYLDVRTGEDINRVWLVSGVTGTLVKTLLSSDLFAVAPWGYQYRTTMLLNLAPTGKTPNYYFEYEQRTIPASQVIILMTNSFTVCYDYSSDTSTANSFYPSDLKFSSVTGSGKWALLRETMFIFDRDSAPKYRWEQIYRGPDGQLYAFRNAYGPQLFKLADMIAQGYGVYNLSDLVNAPEICKITLSPSRTLPKPLQPSPIQKPPNPFK